jgi:hypothetical protein
MKAKRKRSDFSCYMQCFDPEDEGSTFLRNAYKLIHKTVRRHKTVFLVIYLVYTWLAGAVWSSGDLPSADTQSAPAGACPPSATQLNDHQCHICDVMVKLSLCLTN